MGGIWSGTQLMGTLGQHSCPRTSSRFPPKTPQSTSSHQDYWSQLYPIPLNSAFCSVGMSLPWSGDRCQGDTQFHLQPPIPLTSDLTPFLTSLLTADSLLNPFIIQLWCLHPPQLQHYLLFTLPLFLHSYSPLSLPPSMDNLWLIWLVCNSNVYLISIISPLHALSPLSPHHITLINYYTQDITYSFDNTFSSTSRLFSSKIWSHQLK